MKLCFALLVVVLTAWSGVFGELTCSQEGSSTKVHTFNETAVRIQMPCKYNAVRQQCGDYTVVLSPGIITMGNQYRLNTMWLGLKNQNGEEWEGRTTNKKAVKFINGNSTELFTRKKGGLKTEDVLTFSVHEKTTVAKTTDGSMTVTFAPWDPDSRDKGFKKSYWSFKCHMNDAMEPYPKQVCGARKEDGFQQGKKTEDGTDDGMTPEQMFLYNIFMETDTNITQTEEKCLAVENIMQNNCTEEMRIEAMVTCTEIIVPTMTKKGPSQKSNCINKYSCSPMHVFVDCVAWVCGNYGKTEACERIGESIDMCKEFKEGNLTKKVDDAKCYRDFLPIYTCLLYTSDAADE
eukprot:TRINITY_DN32282_c0_g1_i3.p1 TRINITY_DN32282_c0_g1~~TRINITY_DN32282_c0_g1_i3.p1  ORF type:complete len:348 (+),score=67.04 TRINITY_DN32282_c0_g1_i3:166-1209(+)